MANAKQPYLDAIRSTLDAALCLQNFPSQQVERHNKPEIFFRGDKELLLNPIKICRNDRERCLIEPSINSLRFSVKIKQMDELDMVLTGKFTRFLMMRAENFVVLQRKPAKDYDISFLITNEHLDSMWKHKVIDFLIQFMEDVDAQVSHYKISINARARKVGEEFMYEFVEER
eukprot:INCI5705.1.p2 GENE.INCI5705.1~~INCI5705.1.p2  ORF type:complete len:173 (-),score=36.72 INCI5705.1:991-1509(-)